MSVVKHKVFGEGTVIKVTDTLIEIQFGNQVKKFQFPQAFENFLTTEDSELQSKVNMARKAAEPKKPSAPISQHESDRITRLKTSSKSVTRSHIDADNPLVGDRAQTIPVASEEEMFEIVGYMAHPGRVSSIEAEVPTDGRDAIFERMFPGQTYRPIALGDTPSGMPNKLSPQFRINFANLSNCPSALKNNIGKGNGSCIGRINKSKFVITIVQKYGFRFGDWQDVSAIRNIAVKSGYAEAFDRGYAR